MKQYKVKKMLSKKTMLELLKKALLAARKAASAKGEKTISGKQADIKTKGDELAGNAILEVFKKTRLPFVAYSEEIGKKQFGKKPEHSVVFDDLDGTLNYKTGYGMLPHGSIVGIFDSLDPKFEDCIVSGALEFNSGNLFYAIKGNGAYLIENWASGNKKAVQIKTSGRKMLEEKSPLKISLDLYMLGKLAGQFAKYSEKEWPADFRSAAFVLAMVACGALDISITADNCHNTKKRKTGEELGPGYLLVKEAGGAMLGWKGKDIGNEKIGIGEKKGFDVIIAATEQLAKELAEKIQKNTEIKNYIKREKQ